MTDGTGTTTYTYDANNRLTQVTHGSDSYTYAYDPDGTSPLGPIPTAPSSPPPTTRTTAWPP